MTITNLSLCDFAETCDSDLRFIPCGTKIKAKSPLDVTTGFGLKNWSEFGVDCDELRELLESDKAKYQPKALGINLTLSGVACLDCDELGWIEELADLAECSIEELKAELKQLSHITSPRVIVGKRKAIKFLFRLPADVLEELAAVKPGMQITEDDNSNRWGLFAAGKQVVVYGSYNDKGFVGNYYPQGLEGIKDAGPLLIKAIRARLAKYPKPQPVGVAPVTSSADEFVSAVRALTPFAEEFASSAMWFQVMCAIRDGGTRSLAHEFCSEMVNYNAAEIDSRWDNGDFDPVPGGITKATVFKWAQERGWKNPAIGQTSVDTFKGFGAPPGGTEEPQRLFTDDIDKLLELELQERINDAIPLRKEIKKIHGVNDAKITKELLFAIQRMFSPASVASKQVKRRRSVRSSSVQRTIYLHDGLTPAASICQTDGPSDAGKSSYEIEKCIAVVEGRGCFDRDYPTRRGSVLFIATDSGANDFFATLQRLGYSEHPALLQGQLEPGEEGYVEGAPCFFVWAEEPEDGIKAWKATAANIAHLIEFCRENQVLYIVMDSVKTIMGDGVSYTDNQVVAQFMTMLKSTVCLSTGATICLINHDGVVEGEAAGAKAWKENVTMRTRLESVTSPDNQRLGSKALIVKDRVGGQNRSFGYKLASERGFQLMDGAELVSRCDDHIAWILWEAHLNGKPFLKKASILEETRKAGIADSTVSNTLSQCDMADLIRKRSHGQYELTRNQLEAFQRQYEAL